MLFEEVMCLMSGIRIWSVVEFCSGCSRDGKITLNTILRRMIDDRTLSDKVKSLRCTERVAVSPDASTKKGHLREERCILAFHAWMYTCTFLLRKE